MLQPSGTYILQRTSVRQEANILIELDLQYRHEVAAGILVTGGSWTVTDAAGTTTTDLTLASPSVATDGKSVKVRVTDAAARVDTLYLAICQITLSDGTTFPEAAGIRAR